MLSGEREAVQRVVAEIDGQVAEMKSAYFTLNIDTPNRQHRFRAAPSNCSPSKLPRTPSSFVVLTRLVSLPPPTYCADILAEKARAMLWKDDYARSIGTGASSRSCSYQSLEEEKAKVLMKRIEIRRDFELSAWCI
ncbi:hypothetical protein CF326_g893 [Tilletia indica]|nr:hypothetical protein CF326_g893 [Tilletia indica]